MYILQTANLLHKGGMEGVYITSTCYRDVFEYVKTKAQFSSIGMAQLISTLTATVT